MINKSKDDLWNLSKSILQGIFIRFNSDHCIALSLSHFLLLLNFAQILDLSKLSDGCYKYLSKLINGFFNYVTWICQN